MRAIKKTRRAAQLANNPDQEADTMGRRKKHLKKSRRRKPP